MPVLATTVYLSFNVVEITVVNMVFWQKQIIKDEFKLKSMESVSSN